MPELPEIETIVRDIRPGIMGKIIGGMIVRHKCQTSILQTDVQRFYETIIGQSVLTVLRKGKYIIIPLDSGNVIVFHLGMTGKLLLKEIPDIPFEERLSDNDYVDKHTHLIIEFVDPDDGSDLELHFNDIRLFGKIWVAENVSNIEELNIPGLKDLGPDAIGISLSEFEEILQSKRSVKSILLDQRKVAGVGNIYADEALFSANIHPSTKCCSLDSEQRSKLWFAVKSVLKQGIKYRGSSTSDYVDAKGKVGSFQKFHRVYGREGQRCVDCGSLIERIKIIGRSSHFCPLCQIKKEAELG